MSGIYFHGDAREHYLLVPCRSKCGACYQCATAARGETLQLTPPKLWARAYEWQQWHTERLRHRWTVALRLCGACNTEAQGVSAATRHLCWKCMSEPYPFWPTGQANPRPQDLMAHAAHCGSHSWSPTSAPTDAFPPGPSLWPTTPSPTTSPSTSSRKTRATKLPVSTGK